MLQSMFISYMRGYDGKPKAGFAGKGTLLYKLYYEGVSDRKNKLPNRYKK
jgi:hypothetical protein